MTTTAVSPFDASKETLCPTDVSFRSIYWGKAEPEWFTNELTEYTRSRPTWDLITSKKMYELAAQANGEEGVDWVLIFVEAGYFQMVPDGYLITDLFVQMAYASELASSAVGDLNEKAQKVLNRAKVKKAREQSYAAEHFAWVNAALPAEFCQSLPDDTTFFTHDGANQLLVNLIKRAKPWKRPYVIVNSDMWISRFIEAGLLYEASSFVYHPTHRLVRLAYHFAGSDEYVSIEHTQNTGRFSITTYSGGTGEDFKKSYAKSKELATIREVLNR